MRIEVLAAGFAAVMWLCADPGRAAPQAAAVEADDPAKFFLFHLDGVAADVARADLYYCIGQAKDILSKRDTLGSNGAGFLVAAINERFAEIDRFRMRNAAMRKCMALHGYNRYQVPQAQWRLLVNDGAIVSTKNGVVDPTVVDRMAAFAAGPMPAGKRLDP